MFSLLPHSLFPSPKRVVTPGKLLVPQSAGVHEGLEDEDGGHSVDGLGALFDAEVGFAHEPIGLD